MKNKMKKIKQKLFMVLKLGLSISLSHCGLLYCNDNSDYCSNSTDSGTYSDSPGSSTPRQNLDPSQLSTQPREETASGICSDQRTSYLQMSDTDLYEIAIHSNLGNCWIYDARNENYYCTAYVQITSSTWNSHGWPVNPDSRDSTGCVSEEMWPGYTEKMATSNITQNAVEQIRDALRHSEDVCGICNSAREITPEIVFGDGSQE